MSHFRTRLAERRFEAAARRFCIQNGGMSILRDDVRWAEFCDRCCEAYNETAGFQGPLADLLARVVQDFINNPQKYIAIIQLVISLFSATSGEEDGA